jgi:hypothetical protein
MKALLNSYNHPEEKDSDSLNLVSEWEHEIREWESEFIENRETNYFNIDLSDRNMVSGSWKYKFAIFDMIFIYKTFDWENDLMVVYGG